jgi:uncharacterized protein (DUF4415 family)
MSEKRITRRSLSGIGASRTDWARVDATTDADIDRQIAEDSDTAEALTAEWFARAELVAPPKRAINIRLDTDILDYFQQGGSGYQTRINQVLRAYVEARKKSA